MHGRQRQRADGQTVGLQQTDVATDRAGAEAVDAGAQAAGVGAATDAGGRRQGQRRAGQMHGIAARWQRAGDGPTIGHDGDHRRAIGIAQVCPAGIDRGQGHAARVGLQQHIAAARQHARIGSHAQVTLAGLQHEVAAATVDPACAGQGQGPASGQRHSATGRADRHALGEAQGRTVGQRAQQQVAAGHADSLCQRQGAIGHLDRRAAGAQAGQAARQRADASAQRGIAGIVDADVVHALETALHHTDGQGPAGLQRHIANSQQCQPVGGDLQAELAPAEVADTATNLDQQVAGHDVVGRIVAGLQQAALGRQQRHRAGAGIQPGQHDVAGRGQAQLALGLAGAVEPRHQQACTGLLGEPTGAGLDVQGAAAVDDLRGGRLADAALRQQADRALAHLDAALQH